MLYKKHRNKGVSLLKNTKKKYYGNLDDKKVIENKQFWMTIKPLIPNRPFSRDSISLLEK